MSRGYIPTISTPSQPLTGAERDAVMTAVRRASRFEAQPWRIGDMQGRGRAKGMRRSRYPAGTRPRRVRRARYPGRGRRLLIGLLAIAAAVGVGYAILVRTSPGTGSGLRLPSVQHAFQSIGSCKSSVYPAGAQYAFQRCTSSGTPLAWPRCSQLTYRLNTELAPTGYLTDVRQALGQLTAATGLRLIPSTGSADITISWDPTLYDPVPGTTGEAGVTVYRTVTGLSGPHVARSVVRISSHLSPAGTAGVGEEPVLLHELGHAVGLSHHAGPVVMNPVDQGFRNYQPGDLAGLSALYDPASCGAS
jgi:hypothetical protein